MMMTMALFIPETHDSSRRIIRLSFSSCSVKTGGLCETHYPSKTTSKESRYLVGLFSSFRIESGTCVVRLDELIAFGRPGRRTK